NMLLILLV
ncbi:phosphotransferase enzyme family protein, partial [Chlamydia psittaci 84-8471/1]